MNRKYDLVFSMGAACACTECLRYAGLQFSSFPFDWLAGSTLSRRTDILTDGCEGWLRADLLEHVFSVSAIHTDAYRNNATGITFNHDFPMGIPLSEVLPSVVEKYKRRFVRLRSLIARGRRVLVVHITPADGVPPTDGDLAYCRKRLTECFPNAAFDILALRPGKNPEPLCEHPSEGIVVATFDYWNRCDKTGANPVDRGRVIGFLKKLGLKAHDYRSASERRIHRARERAKAYQRFNAKNAFDYLWNNLQYKLYAHLRKRLAKKGLA